MNTATARAAEPESAGNILIVDDDRNLGELVKMKLQAANYEVVAALDENQARVAIKDTDFDLAIVDLKLLNTNGLSLMEEFHGLRPEMPVIILTGFASIENAVDAIKKGAFGYLTKPFEGHELLFQIGCAMETRRLTVENRRLKGLLQENFGFSNIVTRSENMHRVLETVARVAKTESTVYIHGQSGTGKELIAKAIHLESGRKDKPFVAINCATLPESLLESELFGHEKGSFTGAVRSTKGLFAQAHEGTIFLDEIGEMPLSIQVKLLRVLEERVFYPIGSEKPVKINVRVVVATNKDLAEEVKKGTFREDLFYRIHVIPIRLLPLKERKEDIPYLVEHFLKRICYQSKRLVKSITPQALQRLMLHDWPGNVRELENAIEYGVVMAAGDVIGEDLMFAGQALREQTSLHREEGAGTPKNLREARADFEKVYLIDLLEHCDGKAAQAAEIAGKYRADFYDLLKKHGIRIKDYKITK